MRRRIARMTIYLFVIMLVSACQPVQRLPATVPGATTAITIEYTDDGISASADSQAGLVTIDFHDARSQSKPGEPQIARLADGKTSEDYLQALANDPPAAQALLTALGGAFGRNYFNLVEGKYLALLAGPPAEGQPLLAAFSVTGGNAAAVPPTADVEVELFDFSIAMPDEIPAGKQLWHFVNSGQQWHHVLIWQRNEGVTHEEFMGWLMDPEAKRPSPMQWVTGWAAMDAGQDGWAEIDLPAGEYEIVCFLPDFSSTPPKGHLELGMHRILTVR